ncbi:MAG: hypothetical protein JNJ61_11775 [Anaerolineae bacterium]|nr:hypothetical protein [Anaerolineae bacterium]
MMLDRWTVTVSAVLMGFIAVLLGVHLTQETVAAQMDMGDMPMGKYRLTMLTEPAAVQAGQPFTLTLDFFQEDGETPVTEFDEVHTKPLHLILLSADLQQFLHLHPDYAGDGRFELPDTILPQASEYVVFADFTPTGDHQQVIRTTLTTQDVQPAAVELTLSETEFVAGPLRFELQLPEELNAGAETLISFHVTDAESGADIDTLDEYLGSGGHLVLVDSAAEVYIHTHPAEHEEDEAGGHGGMAGMTMAEQYGPHIEFEATFPDVGLYAMWLQVQYEGEVYTAPFVVEVTGEVAPDATMEAHS